MKNIFVTFFNVLAENYQSYRLHQKNQLKYVGIVGAIGFPLFYLIYKYILLQPYESLPIRLVATVLCVLLAIKGRWPEKIKDYYDGYSYFALLYILPFFHVFMSLKNNGDIVFIADSLMAVFFLVLMTDWRNTIVMLLVGSSLASLLYVFTTDNPILPVDYVSRLPTFILIVIGGSLFKYSEKQIQAEKNIALKALAGTIAHEMRNPLGQVKYALDEISHLLPTPNTRHTEHLIPAKTVNDIYTNIAQGITSCNRGLQVIDITLHEVSHQELDATTFEYLSAATITEKAVEEYSFDSPHERSKVSLHVLNDFTFRVDETSYIYIIFNLIKNALYYFKFYPNASITIVINQQKITVTDTGPGVQEHIRSKLFNNFTTDSKSSGTGLGLAYCHRVMQAFGGGISCESVVNQYTTLTLTFPAITQEEVDAHTQAIFQEAISLFKFKRILVVDDQVVHYTSARRMLNGLSCHTDGAENGETAINMLKEESYDLIIMDLIMPGKDGYITAEEIRSGIVPHQKNIPILAHTSESPYMAKIKTQKVGMDGFVSKPCTKLELIKAVRQTMISASHRNSFNTANDYLKGKTILITDDESFNRQYLEIYASEWGMNTLQAESGQDALDMLEKVPHIDIILIDMRMPLMSGIETTQRIRSHSIYHDIIIVALTGHFSEQAMQEAKKAGMDDFVTKPFDKNVLQQKLIHLIRNRNQQEKAPAQSEFDPQISISTFNSTIHSAPTNELTYAEKAYACITEILVPMRQKTPLKETVTAEIFSSEYSSANRYTPMYQSQDIFFKDLPLLDYARLKTSQSSYSDYFQEFLQSMIQNLIRRDNELQIAFDNNDVEAVLNALHSFLGVAGYVGAHALYQYIKLRLYPDANAGRMPVEEAWLETVHALVKISVEVLRRDCVKEVAK